MTPGTPSSAARHLAATGDVPRSRHRCGESRGGSQPVSPVGCCSPPSKKVVVLLLQIPFGIRAVSPGDAVRCDGRRRRRKPPDSTRKEAAGACVPDRSGLTVASAEAWAQSHHLQMYVRLLAFKILSISTDGRMVVDRHDRLGVFVYLLSEVPGTMLRLSIPGDNRGVVSTAIVDSAVAPVS